MQAEGERKSIAYLACFHPMPIQPCANACPRLYYYRWADSNVLTRRGVSLLFPLPFPSHGGTSRSRPTSRERARSCRVTTGSALHTVRKARSHLTPACISLHHMHKRRRCPALPCPKLSLESCGALHETQDALAAHVYLYNRGTKADAVRHAGRSSLFGRRVEIAL